MSAAAQWTLLLLLLEHGPDKFVIMGSLFIYSLREYPCLWLTLCKYVWVSLAALVVKTLPTSEGDIRDASLIPGSEDSLEKAMAAYSSILAWRIPWTEEPGRLWPIGLRRVRHTEVA